jgi:tetratricopeptide (TPR) repeat protein
VNLRSTPLRIVCSTAAWLALAVAGPRAVAQPEDLRALLERALALHQQGDLEGAAAAYEQVVALVPQAARIRSNLGAVYAQLGRYDDAIEQYRLALAGLEGDESEGAVRQNLAIAFQKAARVEEARDEAARLLEAQPGNRDVRLLLADCHVRLGEHEKAVDLLQPAAAAAPEDRAIAHLLGTSLLALGRTSEAQVVMERVFRQDSPEAHLLLASVNARRGDCATAGKELELARAGNAKLPLLNYLQGECLRTQGNWAGAAEAFRRELEVDPNHLESNLHLGNILREEGRYDEALVYLTRAARVRRDAPAVKFSLGALYVSLGRLDEARRLLEEVQAAVPAHVPTQMQLTIVYTRLGLKEEAARARANATRLQREAEGRASEGAPGGGILDLLAKPPPGKP